MGYRYRWRRYVSVASRRHSASKKVAKLKKSGRAISPVEIEGRKIARTFWGQSWCKNLEAYSDYSNRLPRGRTYVRNGSVIDLQIEAGRVRALVSGSSLYDVDIKIKPLTRKRWNGIKSNCAGKIDSMVELLQGSISKGVMEIVTHRVEGLFPSPREISLSCSCPDWATMCKHVAAALYGVGARFDHEPGMLFTLRGVDPADMIATAVAEIPTGRTRGRGRILKSEDVSSVFGIDLDMGAAVDTDGVVPSKRRGRKKAADRKTTKRVSKAKSPAASKKKPSTRKTKVVAKKATARKKSTSRTGTKAKKPATTKRKKRSTRKVVTRKTVTKRKSKKTSRRSRKAQ